jgi:hypothetical protein
VFGDGERDGCRVAGDVVMVVGSERVSCDEEGERGLRKEYARACFVFGRICFVTLTQYFFQYKKKILEIWCG